jgi:hypothetical protein
MSHRYLRIALCIGVVMCGSGCDGGLMGTSTGPGQDSGDKPVRGDVPRLPTKISPRLPGAITGAVNTATTPAYGVRQSLSINAKQQSDSQQTDSQQSSQQQSSQQQSDQLQSNQQRYDQQQSVSRSWALLQPSLQEIESTRITVQEVLALLDRQFDTILESCNDSLAQDGQCQIQAGEIEAYYDDVITQQMVAVFQTSNAATPAADIVDDAEASQVRSRYRELEGTGVVFNQLSIQLPTSTDTRYRLTASTATLLQGRTLQLSWSAAYDQITYDVIDQSAAGNTELYNYRNSVSGQQLTVQRSTRVADSLQEFSIELTAQAEDIGDVYYSARVDDVYLTGQAGDDKAYAYSRDFEEEEGGYFQEIFDEFGYQIAIQECYLELGYACDEEEIEEVFLEYYLSEEEYDDVIDGLGFDDVMVVNLPSDVFEFLVLENDPDVPLLLRDEFCEGWQPFPGDIELFCYAPEYELDDAVVVSIDNGEFSLVAGARVVVEDD